MAIKFDKVTPGSVLLDVHRAKAGNTTMNEWGCWKVRIISVDETEAVVSWNGNAPIRWHRRDVERLYLHAPKAYRDQCAQRGVKPAEGFLAPAQETTT